MTRILAPFWAAQTRDGAVPAAVFAILMAALVTACAGPVSNRIKIDDAALAAEAMKQRQAAVRANIRDLRRSEEVGARVLTGAAPLCGKRIKRYLGIAFWNSHDVRQMYADDKWYRATVSAFGLDGRLRLLDATRGSPAAQAGLAPGDVLVAVNGRAVATGKDAAKKFAIRVDAAIKENPAAISIEIQRDGKNRIAMLRTVPACDYQLVLDNKDVINAFADGKRIIVSRRMLEFARTDDELAVIYGHELAHNFLGHVEKLRVNALGGTVLGTILDALAAAGGVNTGKQFGNLGGKLGALVYSQDFEAEADMVGLYAMALAGYDIRIAPDFWRRMGVKTQKSIDYGVSHPTAPERTLALEKIADEIARKRKNGEPLTPDLVIPDGGASPNDEDVAP